MSKKMFDIEIDNKNQIFVELIVSRDIGIIKKFLMKFQWIACAYRIIGYFGYGSVPFDLSPLIWVGVCPL